MKHDQPTATQQSPEQSESPDQQKQYEQTLRELEQFARWMDSEYGIPGTRIRLGWDVILGFVPILGDALTFLISAYLILRARQVGAPASVTRKMVRNALVDLFGGLAPVVGDAFDIYFKSSTRNIALLREYIEQQLEPPEPKKRFPWLWFSLAFIASVIFILYLLATPAEA